MMIKEKLPPFFENLISTQMLSNQQKFKLKRNDKNHQVGYQGFKSANSTHFGNSSK